MWTRAELKERARAALKPYYWWGVLVCFVAGILGGESGGSGVNFGGNSSNISDLARARGSSDERAIFIFALTAVLIFALVITLLGVFIGNVVHVGKLNYFLESRYRGENAGIGCLFFGFSRGKYLNIVKVTFLKGLFESLWSLLLIIPGIYKHYEYYMVPYLLAEEPAMDRREAFEISKRMMDGHKLNTLVLELSFVGWYMLGLLACCVGMFFVTPYYEAAIAELYLKLKENVFGAAASETVNID